MAEKGFTTATPHFTPEALRESAALEDMACGIETSMAVNVKIDTDLHGPWLVVAEGVPELQGGEMFVEADGFVFYRPASGLGHGVGKMRLLTDDIKDAAGTAFYMEMEIYHYQPSETRLKDHATSLSITGIVNNVYSPSTQYSTFSLLGAWEYRRRPLTPGGDNAAEDEAAVMAGAFNAAKIMPWDATETKSQPWQPKREVMEAFQSIFPERLQLKSHTERAENGRLKKQAEQPAGNAPLLPSLLKEKPHHLDLSPYRISPLSEIYYIPDYISVEEEQQILERIKQTPAEFKTKLKKRTCQEWGCSMCEVCQKSFVSDANMPPWVQQTTDMLLYDGIFSPGTFPNSVRIHEYEKEEGIGPHADGPIYVPQVTILSGASTSVVSFYPRREPHDGDPMEHYNDTFKFKDGDIGAQAPLYSAVLEPRSLLIFRGDAYYFYPHGISDSSVIDLACEKTCGVVMNRHLLHDKDIQTVHRTYRVSLTSRNLLPRCQDQPRRAEYAMKRAWYVYNQLPVPDLLFPSPRPSPHPRSQQQAPLESRTAPLSSTEISQWEAKLDRVLEEQQALKSQLNELKKLMEAQLTSSFQFHQNTSEVLNTVTQSLLDVSSKTEDVADMLEKKN